jgi:hypothetical protein
MQSNLVRQRQYRALGSTKANGTERRIKLMGYLRITRPDGTEILFDEDDEITIYEVCDTCNNPRPNYELTNVGGQTDADAIWECKACHGVNKS